jgi:hypothetical protein
MASRDLDVGRYVPGAMIWRVNTNKPIQNRNFVSSAASKPLFVRQLLSSSSASLPPAGKRLRVATATNVVVPVGTSRLSASSPKQYNQSLVSSKRGFINKIREQREIARQGRAAPYTVRGRKLCAEDPAECAVSVGGRKHGRTSRVCGECGVVTCWKCAGESGPRLLRIEICGNCKAKRAMEEEAHLIIDDAKARRSFQRGAELEARATGGKRRPQTHNSQCGRVEAFTQWAANSEGRIVCLVDFPSANILVRYIQARSNGEKLACKRGAVSAATIGDDLTAIRNWAQRLADEHEIELVDNTYSARVQGELRHAKDYGSVPNDRRQPVEEAKFLEMYDELAHAKDTCQDPDQLFRLQSYFVAIVGLWFLLSRRYCWAHRPYKSSDLQRDLSVTRSQAEVSRMPQTLLWGRDSEKTQFVRALVSGEKNQAQQAITVRWSTDGHFLGVPVAEDLHRTLTEMDMEDGGFLLRTHREGKTAWGQKEWKGFLDWAARRLGVARETLGTTSFRRGYATCLREHGLSPEYIRLLGYWRSDAANDYDGAAMNVRLHVQKAGAGATATTGVRMGQCMKAQPIASQSAISERSTGKGTSTSGKVLTVGGRRFVRVSDRERV